MIKLIKSDIDSLDKNCIILFEKQVDLQSMNLHPDELGYISNAMRLKETEIFINRYQYYLIFVLVDALAEKDKNAEIQRKTGHKICQFLQKNKIESVTILDKTNKSHLALALAEGIILSNYQFLKYFKDATEKKSTLQSIGIDSYAITQKELDQLVIVSNAVYYARDLVNEPANFLTANGLGEAIRMLAKESGFNATVLNKKEIQSLGMGGIMGVNKGSTEPPTFSILEWKPNDAVNTHPIVLIGKGVVYDSGGYSLKPTHDSMDYMKCDMAGAAVVASVIMSITKSKLPVHVIGLIPATDNRIGPDAYSPGDIITMSDGTTVEVMNTDAEGRLILADAITYANRFNPELIIDIATLTGAAHRSIGTAALVGMGNTSKEVTNRIEASGYAVHERVALFPFWDDYAEQLKSDIADLKNVGGDLAGAITAGKFLEYFTKFPYFHMDIAGIAFLKKQDGYRGTGGTGAGVRLLNHFLTAYASDKKLQ